MPAGPAGTRGVDAVEERQEPGAPPARSPRPDEASGRAAAGRPAARRSRAGARRSGPGRRRAAPCEEAPAVRGVERTGSVGAVRVVGDLPRGAPLAGAFVEVVQMDADVRPALEPAREPGAAQDPSGPRSRNAAWFCTQGDGRKATARRLRRTKPPVHQGGDRVRRVASGRASGNIDWWASSLGTGRRVVK